MKLRIFCPYCTIIYIKSKVHKHSAVTNALLAQPVGLETSFMARFEGLRTRMSENSTELGNFYSVAMETENADFEALFYCEGVKFCSWRLSKIVEYGSTNFPVT